MVKFTCEITCGEKTCFAEPGVGCQFLRASRFGTLWSCGIWTEYDKRGRIIGLDEEDGWLLRTKKCLATQAAQEGHK